ncbi:MAG TPA: hypothetical protein VHI13_02710 [Candidatus Kapabacteria bacterium]|nr:hypothetical protein [Candidatus Kapabacteria bacterium]
MDNDTSLPDSIRRINQEIERSIRSLPGQAPDDLRSTIAISNACVAFRRIRSDLDEYLAWLEAPAHELLPLFLLLVRIADAVCHTRGLQQ